MKYWISLSQIALCHWFCTALCELFMKLLAQNLFQIDKKQGYFITGVDETDHCTCFLFINDIHCMSFFHDDTLIYVW